ncbi:hypothetical protein [Burkholderia cenocepacia]|uniref:hypothetical protein n=1 Tax=Burkholderia cenocepacia TaxID=95486 RepID=UPI0013DECAD1|nr:hypothetical protein [Burkholderia cenocepacia]MCW3587375.1 hypothetical protein [Burkholderia cenocepacia]MCW3632579.1 hypothetical protein [Burkholderia cenocepacia]MCW5181810.1 hypothetical protein [Burkholderia cenocepacia]
MKQERVSIKGATYMRTTCDDGRVWHYRVNKNGTPMILNPQRSAKLIERIDAALRA